LTDILAADAAYGTEKVVRQLIEAMENDEARKRHQGKIQYKHRRYDHNYYRPPEDIPMFGYRFDPPYELERLESKLRPREILMCFLRNPNDRGWNSACHITCRERLREFQRSYGPEIEIYAVDVDKLNGEFDHPFSEQELMHIRGGI
jgi:hypothetical protein